MTTFEPIESSSPYSWDRAEGDYDEALSQDTPDEIRSLLTGRRVTKVAEDHLLLDNGAVLRLFGNDGGCACSAGCYGLTELNGVDNMITAVEFEDEPGGDGVPCRTCGKGYCYESGHASGSQGHYKIFVFAEAQKINLATFEGSDGNGYYGTGYHILVRRPRGSAS